MNYNDLQITAKKLPKMNAFLIGLIIVMNIVINNTIFLLIILDIG